MSWVAGWSNTLKEPLTWRRMRETIRREAQVEVTRDFTLRTLQIRFGADAITDLPTVVNTIDNIKFLDTLLHLAVVCLDLDEFRAQVSSLPNPNMLSGSPIYSSR
jgi:hypothetical protein